MVGLVGSYCIMTLHSNLVILLTLKKHVDKTLTIMTLHCTSIEFNEV